MNVMLENGECITLGKNEVLEEEYRCPNCNSQLITSYGGGISCICCVKCDI